MDGNGPHYVSPQRFLPSHKAKMHNNQHKRAGEIQNRSSDYSLNSARVFPTDSIIFPTDFLVPFSERTQGKIMINVTITSAAGHSGYRRPNHNWGNREQKPFSIMPSMRKEASNRDVAIRIQISLYKLYTKFRYCRGSLEWLWVYGIRRLL